MLFTVPLLALVAVAYASKPDKPAMSPPFDRAQLSTNLKANLKPTHAKWDYWGAGWIPSGCKRVATDYGWNPNDFTIFNVHYDDCIEPWTFCRHKDAGFSEIEMIDNFGRLPVHVRSYVRHFAAAPDNTNIRDWAAVTYSEGDIAFIIYPYIDTLMHEITHSMDTHALPGYNNLPFSNHRQWTDEYSKDRHTVTGYGRTSWEEDMADTAMVTIYDKVVPGGFGGLAANWNQVFH